MGFFRKTGDLVDKVSAALDRGVPLIDQGKIILERGTVLVDKATGLVDACLPLANRGIELMELGMTVLRTRQRLYERELEVVADLAEYLESATTYHRAARDNLAVDRDRLELEVARLRRAEGAGTDAPT